MQFMTASDDLRIAYTIDDYTDPWRSAPTLILLHSAMSSSRRLYAMVPHLARHYRVVRMDLRGHGEGGGRLPREAVLRDGRQYRLTADHDNVGVVGDLTCGS